MAEIVTFEIVVDPQTLARSSAGAVTGVLFARLGSQAFPEVGWNDFPVIVLGWWLREVGLGQRSEGMVLTCNFMDGPFSLQLTPRAGGESTVRLLEDGGRRVWGEGIARDDVILTSLNRAGSTIAQACRDQGWSSPDLANLESLLSGTATDLS